MGSLPKAWHTLGVPKEELYLSHTLPVGQTFRWVETREGAFTGIIGSRAYELEQLADSVRYRVVARGGRGAEGRSDEETAEDLEVLREYFQLHLKLRDFIEHWSSCDNRFSAVKEYYPGARLLRQDPVECLFSFVCSSNNNISRIHGMVNNLCKLYGSEIDNGKAGTGAEDKDAKKLYMFPTLEELSGATEETLRAHGFGYRAKFITGTVQKLNSKPGGGAAWLRSLRDVPYKEASAALTELPGVGPKVAACVCLFSLDKFEAIPVDTHVWRLVCTHYRPDLQEKKSVTPRLMDIAERALIDVFGSHAGWAHNVLFLAELAQLKKRLPEKLQTPTKKKRKKAEEGAEPKRKSPKKDVKRVLE
ncbi:DNA glycosylase [Chloropicon primus]|uniref:DNA-(apurinic or apyrimidinic site) lyase n=1 Tax=Chloropicon primus TaxID=1764295 RepID=A0A5B8MH29_9CHLO|nr:DNA glycosylase [Chloropicon primus]UPQ98793.1 DNA glycosylase [Chloropicon primus]|eukprot:QDZ19581.1 DNA glycosylase [Chloropicon primus]